MWASMNEHATTSKTDTPMGDVEMFTFHLEPEAHQHHLPEVPICPLHDRHVPGGVQPLIALYCLRTAISILVVFVDLFIVWALWTRRRYHPTIRTSLFVLNLALTGVIGGLCQLIFVLVDVACPVATLFAKKEAACMSKIVIGQFSWMLSANALAAIAFDRYIFLVHSLRYTQLMTRRRALALIGSVYLVAALGASCVLLDNTWKHAVRCDEQMVMPPLHLLAVQVPMNLLVLSIVTATHLRIRVEVKRTEILRHENTPTPHLDGLNVTLPSREWTDYSAKSARLLTIVVGFSLLAFTPLQVVQLLQCFGIGDDRTLHVAFNVSRPIFTVHLINPFIYVWKNATLRADLRASWLRVKEWIRWLSRQSAPMHDVIS